MLVYFATIAARSEGDGVAAVGYAVVIACVHAARKGPAKSH